MIHTPNHLRQQGYRDRKRRGATIVKINVSLAQIEGLELAGYLAPGTELSEALEQFFSDSISEWLQTQGKMAICASFRLTRVTTATNRKFLSCARLPRG